MARDMVQVRAGSRAQFRAPQVSIGRSQFNGSHEIKTTFDASYLIPIANWEVLPGDTFTCDLDGFCRVFSPLDAPIMDNIELETFFFFTPTRLLWDNWEAMNGAHDAAGAQDTDYTVPRMTSGLTVSNDQGTGVAQLAGYLGLPHGLTSAGMNFSALPFRNYQFVYSEWFRDQNLIDQVVHATDNGPDTPGNYQLLKSAKKHGYFTSALPYLQKGDPVTVPIGTRATINYDAAVGTAPVVYSTSASAYRNLDSSGPDLLVDSTSAGSGTPNSQEIYADLTTATGVSVNALRESVAIQRLLERDARGGTRYTEMLYSQFGVTSPDFRLQRPEYLGGGRSWINVSPVANTSDTASVDQGELRGIGTGVIRGHGWAKSFTEHGYILGLVRARGDITYFQGVDKLWTRSTRYDFYIPALANLGEQSILNKELYYSNSPATDDLVFGYQERWAEYRSMRSRITGTFDPNVTGSLSFWHLAEDFASLPSLNQTFIEDQTPMSRVTTVDTEHDFLMHLRFNLKMARPIPVYSVPSLMPRF